MSHRLDHLVLPVANLAVARARLSALGFTVAPIGVHPFGTENCCVYFPGGAFLEPLAVRDDALAGDSAARGNVFVARDGAFRSLHGDEGLSALVLATDDADADHERLRGLELSAGDMLTFSRPFADAAGSTGTATFKLAFGGASETSDGFFFTCERVGVPPVDRSSLERHENGVTGVAEIALTGQGGKALLAAMSLFIAAGGAAIDLAGSRVRWFGDDEFTSAFALRSVDHKPPFSAVSFRVASLDRLSGLLSARGIGYTQADARLVVPAAPGQGIPFAFEESA